MLFRSRTPHPRRLRLERWLRPSLENLETRLAPAGSGSPVGYTPPEIQAAYGINPVTFGTTPGNGSGQDIAIVCPYSDTQLFDSSNSNFSGSDLGQFDLAFDLPQPPSFQILNEFGTDIGGTSPLPRPPADPGGPGRTRKLSTSSGDAVAPDAGIVLIECNSDSATDMFTGLVTAAGFLKSRSW